MTARFSRMSLGILAVLGVAILLAESVCAVETSNKRPNVLLIFTDQQQAGMMSAYDGARVSTPAMDSLAARGVRVATAYCVTPHCSPSLAACLTGRWPPQVNMTGAPRHPTPPVCLSTPPT